jgi:hypothetical protein
VDVLNADRFHALEEKDSGKTASGDLITSH